MAKQVRSKSLYPDEKFSMKMADLVQKEADRIFKNHAEWKPTKKGGLFRLHFGGRVLREKDSNEMMRKIEEELVGSIGNWCLLSSLYLRN